MQSPAPTAVVTVILSILIAPTAGAANPVNAGVPVMDVTDKTLITNTASQSMQQISAENYRRQGKWW